MLIAMMGNTYSTVIAQAEKAWRQQVSSLTFLKCEFIRVRGGLSVCPNRHGAWAIDEAGKIGGMSVGVLDQNWMTMETQGWRRVDWWSSSRQRKQGLANENKQSATGRSHFFSYIHLLCFRMRIRVGITGSNLQVKLFFCRALVEKW